MFLIRPLFALVFFLVLVTDTIAGEVTFYLLRHAEKVTTNIEDPDPALTQEGHTRAAWMADYLADKGVSYIFSSNYRRTLETVAPLSKRLDIPIEIYDPHKLPEFAAHLKTMKGVIVVSGHSNTTPELAQLLSGQDMKLMPESEYDRFYEIRIVDHNSEVLVHRSQPPSH